MRAYIVACAVGLAALASAGHSHAASGCLNPYPAASPGSPAAAAPDTAQHGMGGCGMSKSKRHHYHKQATEMRYKQEMATPATMGNAQTP